ncbi:hypothetical protein VUR80DRAFT_2900 [Thermomyces stellatus]
MVLATGGSRGGRSRGPRHEDTVLATSHSPLPLSRYLSNQLAMAGLQRCADSTGPGASLQTPDGTCMRYESRGSISVPNGSCSPLVTGLVPRPGPWFVQRHAAYSIRSHPHWPLVTAPAHAALISCQPDGSDSPLRIDFQRLGRIANHQVPGFL